MLLSVPVIFILGYLFYVGSILIHILVIKEVIPYHVINGGRSTSYPQQAKQSKSSIIVLLVMVLFVTSALVFPSFRNTLIFVIITSILTLFWLLGTVLQLLGTRFEKYALFWLNLIGLFAHIELVLLYFLD